MITEKRKRLNDAFETVKTVLLGLFVLSLLMLIVVYIGGTHIYQSMTQDEEKKSFDKLWSVQSGFNTEGLDGLRLLPEFIGYKLTTSEPVASIADRDTATELYGLIKPCLLELFGSGSVCTPLAQFEGEARFNEAARSSEYIYIRYHEPVLYQLIYAYASDKLTIADNDVAVMKDNQNGAYVSEIIIIPDKSYAAHRFIAYACDGEGNYFEFQQDQSIVASIFHISKLSDSGTSIDTLPFAFIGDAQFSPGQPMIDAELETEDIISEPVQILNTVITQPLMRLFGYNPDKLNGYTDENGVGNYFDSRSRIRFETGGFIYQAGDASMGIKLDSLLGYSVDDSLNLFDKLIAVDNLISRLGEISPGITGGEASLCLGEVYTEDGMIVFEYFNTYKNIRISGGPAVRAVLAQERLYSFELYAQSYKGTDLLSFSPSQSYVLRKLRETGSLTNESSGLNMRFKYLGETAGWSVERVSGEVPESQLINFSLR